LTNGLVGYWTFDGSSIDWNKNQASDMSGNGNTGQLVSMSTSTSPVAGKIGQALRFTAGPQVIVTSGSPVTSKTAFTMSAWVKNDFSPPPAQSGIFMISGTQASLYVDSDGQARAYLYCCGGSPTWHQSSHNSSVSSWKLWHYVAYVYDGSKTIVYIDSQPGTSDAAESGSVITSGTQFSIGGHDSGSTFRWTGVIDEARYYDRALSASEIQQLYNAGR
jgi:hypothetical protein